MELDNDISNELNRKAEIIDISHRFSAIRVSVRPSLLFGPAPHLSNSGMSHWTPLAAAVHAADVEAIKEILALHELCDPSFPVNPHAELENILQSDSPAILDLFIRKFGVGLGLFEEEDDDPQGSEAIKKMPKTYLGLDVHGVKRKDLAKRNDPDAPRRWSQPHHIPLLWSAATKGATKVIDWLATPAPLEAYTSFMASASEEDVTAKALRNINGFETQLPELLGFLLNELGETAVFAALVGQQKEEQKIAIVKQLYKLSPHLQNTFTASRVKGTELTPILFICANNCGKDLFDFFLGQGANTMDVDHKGYVVSSTQDFSDCPQIQHPSYHVLIRQSGTPPTRQPEAHQRSNVASYLPAVSHLQEHRMYPLQNSRDLLTHLFQPIMLAVKASRPHIVDFMLSIDNPATPISLSLRDVQGSLPLHIAVKKGFTGITTSLLKFSEPRFLYTEDGVGITPLEIASLPHLLHLTRSKGKVEGARNWATPLEIPSSIGDRINKYSERVERPEIEAAETLSALVQSLDAEGCFKNKMELKEVLTDYAERTMKIARRPKKKEEAATSEPQTDLGFKTESSDIIGTFELMKGAVGHSTRRELVHLLDAQRAVGNALDQAIGQYKKYTGYEARDELGEESAEKTQVKLGLLQILGTGHHFYNKEAA